MTTPAPPAPPAPPTPPVLSHYQQRIHDYEPLLKGIEAEVEKYMRENLQPPNQSLADLTVEEFNNLIEDYCDAYSNS